MAVIGGTSIRGSDFAAGAERVDVGGVALLDTGGMLVLQRHGIDHFIAPHEIDHLANMRALGTAGADRIVGLASVGSLRTDWPVGTAICPDDFYAPQVTVSLKEGYPHDVPGFDPVWRQQLVSQWREHATHTIEDGGVYAQTTGPRFETRAEVRALAAIADVVGMTIAAECMLAKEAGIAYAAVCLVDNLANGIGDRPLTTQDFLSGVAANRAALLRDLDAVLPHLTGATP